MTFSSGSAWAVGEMYGHRVFNVYNNDILSPVQGDFTWQDGVNVSKCRSCSAKRRAGCFCGFYAYYDYRDQGFSGDVHGVIRGYGMVDKGELGFKAEKAEIESIYIPKHLIPAGIDPNASSNPQSATSDKKSLRDRWKGLPPSAITKIAVVFGAMIVVSAVLLSIVVASSLLWSIVAGAMMLIGVVGYVKSITRLGRKTAARGVAGMAGFKWDQFRANYPTVKVYTSVDKMFADYEDVMKQQRAAMKKPIEVNAINRQTFVMGPGVRAGIRKDGSIFYVDDQGHSIPAPHGYPS